MVPRCGGHASSRHATTSTISGSIGVPPLHRIDASGSNPITIRMFPGRDLGIAASRSIASGEALLIEKPLIRLTPNIGRPIPKWYGDPQRARMALGNLSRAGPKKTVATWFEEELDPVISTNSFTLEDKAGSCHSFVFHNISRFNHSCDPSAVLIWDPDTEKATVRAIRDIKPGCEITLNYGAVGSRAQRAAHLKMCFGFNCTCSRCTSEAIGPLRADWQQRRPSSAQSVPRGNEFRELVQNVHRMYGPISDRRLAVDADRDRPLRQSTLCRCEVATGRGRR